MYFSTLMTRNACNEFIHNVLYYTLDLLLTHTVYSPVHTTNCFRHSRPVYYVMYIILTSVVQLIGVMSVGWQSPCLWLNKGLLGCPPLCVSTQCPSQSCFLVLPQVSSTICMFACCLFSLHHVEILKNT